MNSSFAPFPIDLNEDHHQHDDHIHNLFSPSSSYSKTTTTTHHEDHNYASSSSNNSISYPFFTSPSPHDLSPFFQPLHHQDHQAENLYGGSLGHPSTENESGNKISICKKEDRENGSVKWMSSKMRLMRKMINSVDQTVGNTCSQNSNSVHKFGEDQKGGSSSLEVEVEDKNFVNNNNSTIRVCADCNTTKTPLWRSGPRGPKSLCNACGIRQRKARRALAAAQESENGAIFGSKSAGMKSSKLKNKDEKSTNNSHLPFKKRCKFTAQGRGKKNKLCFEDLSSILLSKNSAFHQQVFPQDEKEAAVLLMALSYGLVRG